MPAYNEEALSEFLAEIEDALHPVTAGLRFVVIDDASTTMPPELEPLPLGSPTHLIRNTTNLGHGPSALRAYAAGLSTDPDLVVHVDGDGQFLGRDFVALLDAISRGADGVVGARIGRREPWYRKAMTAGAKTVTGTGLRGCDPNSPLRAYRPAVLERLLEKVRPDSVVPHLHFTILHDRLGLDVEEVPVTHRPRRGLSTVGTTWQGARAAAILPGRRLLRLAGRATHELARRRAAAALVSVALGAMIIATVAPGFGMHLNYDEAYNLQIVTNLLHGNGYATDGVLFSGQPQHFDYRITTGPPLMLPIAAAAATFGEHLWVYRLVPTIAFIALIAAWWAVGRTLAGRRRACVGGVAAALGVLALDTAGSVSDSQAGAGTVIGETTATLFLLLAIMLSRRPGRAGLCLGLAVMTKVLVLVAVPGVAVAVAISAGRARSARALAMLTAAAAVPAALWQIVRVVSLGWSGAMRANGDFLAFLRGHGAGSPDPFTQLARQIHMGLGFGVAVVLLAAVLAGGRLISGARPKFQDGELALVTGILVAGLALEGYWLLLESEHFVRHSYQAAQLLLPLALVLLVRTVPSLRVRLLRDVVATVAVVLTLTQVAFAVRGAWNPPGPTLSEQRQVADMVAYRGSTYRFVGISMTPEVTFFHPELHPERLTGAGGLLVSTGLFGRTPTNGCPRVVAERAGYVLCDVPPAADAAEVERRLGADRGGFSPAGAR